MSFPSTNSRISIKSLRSRIAERRFKRRVRALVLILFSALVTTQVFPTLAENRSPSIETGSETGTATTLTNSETLTVTSDGSTSEATQSQGDNLDSEPTESPEPSPSPPSATDDQSIFIAMPASLRVDPRAGSVFLPRIALSSSNALLVCITSASLQFDLGATGLVDDSEREELLISGDRTNSLMISGVSNLANGLINSEKGLRIFREGGGISGHSAVFRFIDISEPALDETLCSDGEASNNRVLQILPLGLTQSITKAKVGLEKGKKG